VILLSEYTLHHRMHLLKHSRSFGIPPLLKERQAQVAPSHQSRPMLISEYPPLDFKKLAVDPLRLGRFPS
jgi:hypothetical protein